MCNAFSQVAANIFAPSTCISECPTVIDTRFLVSYDCVSREPVASLELRHFLDRPLFCADTTLTIRFVGIESAAPTSARPISNATS